jgi:hypothetical protein
MEYKRASAYVATVDRNKKKEAQRKKPESEQKKRVKVKIAKLNAKRKATRMIAKAEREGAKKTGGKVSKDVRLARAKVKAQVTGQPVKVKMGHRLNKDKTRTALTTTVQPARVLRRPTQADIYEVDRIGLDFPELHDEFKKTMSLLHGGDVGDSL